MRAVQLITVVVNVRHDVRGLIRMVAPQPAEGGSRSLHDAQLRIGDLELVVVDGPDLEVVEVGSDGRVP